MRTLAVWLDGAPGPVGLLTGEAGGGFPLRFVYDPDYLRNPQAVPISAALPLRGAAYLDADARVFFDNLLPEGERRRGIALAARVDASDVTALLAALGSDCPGAVSVLRPGAPPVKSPGRLTTDYDPLTPAALDALVADTAAGRSPGERVRFSLAGVQEKLALARDPSSGAFLVPRAGAPTTWMLKIEPPRGSYRGIVGNEALCLFVLRRLGLPAVHAERTVIAGMPVLLVARYDRVVRDGVVLRRHQEDAAQVLGVPRELKYETDADNSAVLAERRGFAALLGRVAGLTRGPADARVLLVRAAHTNWLLGNCDAHLKKTSRSSMGWRQPARHGWGMLWGSVSTSRRFTTWCASPHTRRWTRNLPCVLAARRSGMPSCETIGLL